MILIKGQKFSSLRLKTRFRKITMENTVNEKKVRIKSVTRVHRRFKRVRFPACGSVPYLILYFNAAPDPGINKIYPKKLVIHNVKKIF